MLACIIGSMYLISVSDTIWTLLAAAVVGAFGYGAAGPVARAMAMGVVPEERRGAASSTLYLGSDLGQLAGPVVGGLIATTLGYAAMYRIAPVSILLAAVVLLVARRTLERRRNGLVIREETGSTALVVNR